MLKNPISSVLPYINNFRINAILLRLCHQPLCGITCNDNLHKNKSELQHLFFLASSNMFFTFSKLPKGNSFLSQTIISHHSSPNVQQHTFLAYSCFYKFNISIRKAFGKSSSWQVKTIILQLDPLLGLPAAFSVEHMT